MHGVTRLAGTQNFKQVLLKEFEGTILPIKLTAIFSTVLPYIETVVGTFLLVGLLTHYVMLTGSTIMLVLLFGKSLKSDWPTVTFQMVYLLIYSMLLALAEYNTLSLDQLFLKYVL